MVTLRCLFTSSLYYVGKVIEFGFIKQLKEMAPSLLYSLSMGIIIYISILFISSMWIKLLVGILVGISYYFLISFATKSQELSYIFALVRERKK